jgi:hypothetical protein
MESVFLLIGLVLVAAGIMAVVKVGRWVFGPSRTRRSREAPPDAGAASHGSSLKGWLGVISTILGIVSTSVGLVTSCQPQRTEPSPEAAYQSPQPSQQPQYQQPPSQQPLYQQQQPPYQQPTYGQQQPLPQYPQYPQPSYQELPQYQQLPLSSVCCFEGGACQVWTGAEPVGNPCVCLTIFGTTVQGQFCPQ